MGYLAKADGHVSENEINAAQAVMTYLHLTPTQKQAAIRLFNEGKQPDFVLELALYRFREACQERADLIRKFMEIQFSVLYADGIPHLRKRVMLLNIANRLGFSRLLFDTMDTFIRGRFRHQDTGRGAGQKTGNRRATATREIPLSQAYATLGLTHRATNDEVKKAYRRLLNRHHPDKLAAQNLSAEALAQTTDKTREVKAAYERIKIARGL
jgi:DnaJ like chaperone protein